MLDNEDLDILCVSESWLDCDINSNYINIEGYNLFRYDNKKSAKNGRKKCRRSGGSCIYVKTTLLSEQIYMEKEVCDGIEMVWLKIQLNFCKSIIIGSLYRHPNAPPRQSLEFIEKLLRDTCEEKHSFYLFGDFNIDVLKKNNPLSKILNRLSLSQLVEHATRITDKSKTLIDLAITNVPNTVFNTDVSPSIADHYEITCDIKFVKNKFIPVQIRSRDMRQYSKEQFVETLSAITYLNQIWNTDDVNKQVKLLVQGVNEAQDICAPIRTVTIKRRPIKWHTAEVRESAQRLKAQRVNLKANPSDLIEMNRYKKLKKEHRKTVTDARRRSTHADLSQNKKNPKQMWKVISSIVPHKPAKTTQKNFDSPLEKASEFNEFYSQVGEKVYKEVYNNPSNPPEALRDSSLPTSENQPLWKPQPLTNLSDIRRILFSLKNTNATGYDNITLKFIKDGFLVIGPLLHTIINTSIATNTFPTAWKQSIIKPLFKSGNTSSPSNYRPISLLPVFSKILEKAIANQLSNFLENSNKFHRNQYAYRANISTQDALLNINEKIYQQMDSRQLTLLILLDLSKAFDSVDHQLLVSKLESIGVNPAWFQSYLDNRTHAVSLESSLSPFLKNKFGVPQGSILGPILFSIFVNDIPITPSDCKISMYADDVQIAIPFSPNEAGNTRVKAEGILTELKEWYDRNGLKLNSNKTQCIIIGAPHLTKAVSDFALHFAGSIITPVSCVKNLGVWYDTNMTFEPHINKICKKINGTLMYLNKIKHYLDEKSRLLVTQSLVLSHFHYCPLVWGRANKGTLEQLQKCWNFTAKVVVNGKFSKRDHVTPLLKKLGWPKLEYHLLLNELKFVYTSLNSERSTAQLVEFTPSSAISNRETRHHNTVTQFRNNDYGKKALSISGAHNWNKLPNRFKEPTTLGYFSNQVLSFIENV